MNILSILHGLFIVGSNKAWGEQMLLEEGFLSNIAKFACIFGALRFFWSFFVDSYGFKIIYALCILIQIVIGLTMPRINEIESMALKQALFGACVCISYNIEGAHFVLAPTVYAKLFGPKGGIRVFSVGFSFVAAGGLINMAILERCLDTSSRVYLGMNGI